MKAKGVTTDEPKGEKLVTSDFVKLGKRMKELRLKNGYKSFETFAYDHNLPRVLYGNYEKGIGNITYKNLLKVVKALKISLRDFFNEGFD
jgi:transcriptional regulator with XRE-family HTH domain